MAICLAFFVDCPRLELKKQGGVLDWAHGSSLRSVPDRPCIEPYKRGGVPSQTQMFCLVFEHNTIVRTRRENQCLPYADFLKRQQAPYKICNRCRGKTDGHHISLYVE